MRLGHCPGAVVRGSKRFAGTGTFDSVASGELKSIVRMGNMLGSARKVTVDATAEPRQASEPTTEIGKELSLSLWIDSQSIGGGLMRERSLSGSRLPRGPVLEELRSCIFASIRRGPATSGLATATPRNLFPIFLRAIEIRVSEGLPQLPDGNPRSGSSTYNDQLGEEPRCIPCGLRFDFWAASSRRFQSRSHEQIKKRED